MVDHVHNSILTSKTSRQLDKMSSKFLPVLGSIKSHVHGSRLDIYYRTESAESNTFRVPTPKPWMGRAGGANLPNESSGARIYEP